MTGFPIFEYEELASRKVDHCTSENAHEGRYEIMRVEESNMLIQINGDKPVYEKADQRYHEKRQVLLIDIPMFGS
jgi:hypothetical protein